MKDPARSVELKPVGNNLARNRRIALQLNRTVTCHQNTVENGITSERNLAAGSDNIEQNLVPLQSGQLNMRIAF
jgi:hypothetical protein